MAEALHYCTIDQAKAIATPKGVTFQDEWLTGIDALIERHANGQGYKGKVRTTTTVGRGNRLLYLDSIAAGLLAFSENGQPIDMASLQFVAPSRCVRRLYNSAGTAGLWPNAGIWPDQFLYVVTYREPTDAPPEWEMAAAHCVATMAMWVKKYETSGIALTTSDSGQAGKAGAAQSTSFPPDLSTRLKMIIGQTVQRRSY